MTTLALNVNKNLRTILHLLLQVSTKVCCTIMYLIFIFIFIHFNNKIESKRKSPEEQTTEVKRKKIVKTSDKIGIQIHFILAFNLHIKFSHNCIFFSFSH